MQPRKFGEIPDWAKRGAVSLANYDFRAEEYGAKMKWGQNWPFLSRDEGVKATASEGKWDQYFRDHLGGFPPTYTLYRDGVIKFLNVPETEPEVFDPTYRPVRLVRETKD